MGELMLPEPFLRLAESGRITSEDVVLLRREVFKDNIASKFEAEALIALDRAAHKKCPQWSDFFSEVLTDYIVYQEDPEGAISQENADWLINCISRNGLVDSRERFEMLIKVLERANTSPEILMTFALDQVKLAVIENQGPVCTTRAPEKRVICSADVELIRRLMYAFGGDGGMAVTKTEAEFLFDLNDQTIEYENDPAWSDLFVKAVGNHLMASLGNAVPTRNIALKQDEFLQGDGFYETMINSLRSVYRAVADPTGLVESAVSNNNDLFEAGLAKAADITSHESDWVAKRIGADGIVHENEKALLRFISEQSNELPDRLSKLLKDAA